MMPAMTSASTLMRPSASATLTRPSASAKFGAGVHLVQPEGGALVHGVVNAVEQGHAALVPKTHRVEEAGEGPIHLGEAHPVLQVHHPGHERPHHLRGEVL